MQVPAYVEYEKATSVEHALALLARFGPEARILAGGHSLIPMMKLRLVQPETLIDINGLSELCYIGVAGGELRIGALTRHAQLLDSVIAGRALRDPARRRAGHRRPGRAQLGHDRRIAVPGRPVRGPVRDVRGTEGQHDHPRPRRQQDRVGAGIPHRALRNRRGPGRAADRDQHRDQAQRRQRLREGGPPGGRLADRRGRGRGLAGRRDDRRSRARPHRGRSHGISPRPRQRTS